MVKLLSLSGELWRRGQHEGGNEFQREGAESTPSFQGTAYSGAEREGDTMKKETTRGKSPHRAHDGEAE